MGHNGKMFCFGPGPGAWNTPLKKFGKNPLKKIWAPGKHELHYRSGLVEAPPLYAKYVLQADTTEFRKVPDFEKLPSRVAGPRGDLLYDRLLERLSGSSPRIS